MRTAAQIALLQRITASVEAKIEDERPRWEAMVRAEHAGDERMTQMALDELERELAKMPEQILDQILKDLPKHGRLH